MENNDNNGELKLDFMEIVNKHHEDVVNAKKEVKRQKIKRKIKTALLLTAGISIGVLASKSANYIEGRTAILNDFNEELDDTIINIGSFIRIGDVQYSDTDPKAVFSFADGVKEIIAKEKEQGLDEQEIAVGLSSYGIDASEYLDTNISKRLNACMNSYHSAKSIDKGVSK